MNGFYVMEIIGKEAAAVRTDSGRGGWVVAQMAGGYGLAWPGPAIER